MYPSATFLTALSATVLRSVLAKDCDCYLTDGSSPTYFSQRGFWDFRSLEDQITTPRRITTFQGNLDAPATSPLFEDGSDFTEFFWPQNWANRDSDVRMANSRSNLYISRNEGGESDTFLTMRTHRQRNFQSAAEFESIANVDHASMRMHARTRGAKGACTAMFTYRDADRPEDVQESDIEILTNDPRRAIQYTNQPSYLEETDTVIEGASRNVTLPKGKPWNKWATHRLDWTPGMTTWSVDGQETFAMSFQAPVDPSRVIFNAWSNGGDWTGVMDVGKAAYQEIQWIEVLYGVTKKSSCNKVCSVDKSNITGVPVAL